MSRALPDLGDNPENTSISAPITSKPLEYKGSCSEEKGKGDSVPGDFQVKNSHCFKGRMKGDVRAEIA